MWCKFTELYELNEVSNNFQNWKLLLFYISAFGNY